MVEPSQSSPVVGASAGQLLPPVHIQNQVQQGVMPSPGSAVHPQLTPEG